MAIQMIPTTYDAESKSIDRRRQQAQMLRQQSQEPLPSGQMVSGHYVPTSPLHGLAQGIKAWGAGVGMREADKSEEALRQKQQDDLKSFSQALRGNAPPEMIRSPVYQQDPLQDRLSGLEGNPYATQMATQLAMKQAEQQMEPVDQNQLILPDGTINQNFIQAKKQLTEATREPKAPGRLIQNERGEWVPNSAYIQAESQIAEAGKSDPVNVNVGAGDMQTEQGKELGRYLGGEFTKIQEQATEASQQMGQLERLDQLLEGVHTGKGMPTLTNLQGLASTFGIEIGNDLGQKEAAESLTNQIALRFRNPESGMGLPGATSDRDIGFLKSLPPGIGQSEDGRKLIMESFRRINKKKMDVAAKARELVQANAKQGVNGLTWSDMDTLQGMWAEPMFDDELVSRAESIIGGAPQEDDPELDALLNKYAD